MRHGWEWWEAFWRYLLEMTPEKTQGWVYPRQYLKTRKKEFEEKWRREAKIKIPHPENQSSP